MTGIGIGRFANRKAAKAVDGALSNAETARSGVAKAVAVETTVGHSEKNGVWTDTSQDPCRDDPMGNDFPFSELRNSAAFGAHELETSFDKASFTGNIFVGREGDLQFDEASMLSTWNGDNKDVSIPATTSVSNGVTPMASSGFSRFANKNKTPTADEKKFKSGDRVNKDENLAKTSTIAETPNHAEDNDVTISKSRCNNNEDVPKSNKSPAQSPMISSPLASTKKQPSVAMELDDAPREQINKESEQSRQFAFKESSSLPKDSLPTSEPKNDHKPQGQTKQYHYKNHQHENHQHEGIISKFGGTVPNIIPGSRSELADAPRTPNGIPMNAREAEESLQRKQQKRDEQNRAQPLQREIFNKVPHNQVTQKRLSFAAAITPNHSNNCEKHQQNTNDKMPTSQPTFHANRESVLEIQGKDLGLNTTSGVATSQKPTTNFSETGDRQKGANKNINNLDNFESNQAKFLMNIRETEDLQERIEMDLLDMNDRFAEHYALLLRDLDVAVDLVDKVEGIEKLVDEILARHQDPTGTPNDDIVTERVCELGTKDTESKSDP